MQEYRIAEYGSLNTEQKGQAIEIFVEGFGHMMTFSKDKDVLKALFKSGFDDSLFLCYVEKEKVLGIMGLGTNRLRPLKFDYDLCAWYCYSCSYECHKGNRRRNDGND